MSELLMLKGIISEMPEESKIKIKEASEKIKAVVTEYGDEGLIALALTGGEYEEMGMKT